MEGRTKLVSWIFNVLVQSVNFRVQQIICSISLLAESHLSSQKWAGGKRGGGGRLPQPSNHFGPDVKSGLASWRGSSGFWHCTIAR